MSYIIGVFDNINEAVQCLLKDVENDNQIHIIVDPDCDGQCSAAMLYRYLEII